MNTKMARAVTLGVALTQTVFHQTARADVSVNVSTWQWSGAGDWFVSDNWCFGVGPLAGAPNLYLPVYFGPVEKRVNGVLAGYEYPAGQAVLSDNYRAPKVDMATGVDTALKIRNNATLDSSISVGLLPTNGAPLPAGGTATVELDGGHVTGTLSVGVDSTGVLKAKGTSSIGYLTIANTAGGTGTASIASGSTLSVSTQTWFGAGTSTLNNAGTANLASVSGTLGTLVNSGTLNYTGTLKVAALTNAGTIAINGNASKLDFAGPATLSGGGVVRLGYSTASLDPTAATFTNADNAIEGIGSISANFGTSFVNHGTVNANVAGEALAIHANYDGTFSNTGLLTATNGGRLELWGAIKNAGGTIHGTAGSTIELRGGTIVGGTVSGTVSVATSYAGTITGTLNNIGTLVVGSPTFNGVSHLYGNGTLSGGGTVRLANPSGALLEPAANSTFTNADNTIEGVGLISAANGTTFVNQGTIKANVAGQALVIYVASGGAFTNTGLLTATNGGRLEIWSPFDNSGTVSAQGGIVKFNDLSVADGFSTSGTLSGGATIYSASTTRGVRFSQPGTTLELTRGGSIDPLVTVKAMLAAGYATAFATGSLRVETPGGRMGLGYRETSSGVAVRYTLYGDADLDGGVSIDDFNAMAAGFGQSTGKSWVSGDFDYDGGVSINDFNLMAGGFAQSVPSSSVMWAGLLAFAAAHHDLAAFEAATGVPEPMCMALLGISSAGLRRRRSSTAASLAANRAGVLVDKVHAVV